ncbi:Ribonuclease T2 [Chelonia mydas]|uniref:Ribonuclease T2 n=1 Tax=Chelonia mydas TaxID=8469 RepID=M7AZD6_CHEMY|nr:Ribonuclease T2 [Chelonia mydas]
MLSEVLKEQHSDAETTEPEPPKKKINLLLVASDSDNENENVCSALDCYLAEPVICMDTCPWECEHHPHTWKKLFLVHHWPVTVCKMSENDCKDPPQYWTIHGLWKHEWEKHGTCAATVEPLNSQKKYFGRTLDLYQKLDLNSCLLKVGIKPGSTYYQMTAIKEALTSVYGVTPKVQCLPPEEGEEVQTIGQIEFCFTKDLELRNCTHSEAESYVMPNNWHFGPEELSVCNDTLTYYPAQVQFYN